MIVNVFDLTGRETFYRVKTDNIGNPGEEENIVEHAESLNTVLIQPRENSRNYEWYLQRQDHPIIEDFYGNDGTIDFQFNNTFILSDFLNNLLDRKNDEIKHLQIFFELQTDILKEKQIFNEDSDPGKSRNILLVPDWYNAEMQEVILRNCGMPRRNKKTLLLWRSAAICLGAYHELVQWGIRENDLVIVIDVENRGVFHISVLSMKRDGDWLVPVRRYFSPDDKKDKNGFSYTTGGECHPCQKMEMRKNIPEKSDDKIYDFWLRTWRKAGTYLVPDPDNNWKQQIFGDISFEWQLSNDFWKEIRKNYSDEVNNLFVIMAGTKNVEFSNIENFGTKHIIYENPVSADFAALGAGRFSYCDANGLPTYFDECPSLYFIHQDTRQEQVYQKEIIKGKEYCKGGERLEGEKNTDFELIKDSSSVNFYLHLGGCCQRDTPLRELKKDFEKVSKEKQPLVLFPGMIPGQGVAQVIVDAKPLIDREVELDFSKMTEAKKDDKPVTMDSLENQIKRSYPIDFPDVEASESEYSRIKDIVQSFAEDKTETLKGDCFQKSKWPYRNEPGIKAFGRTNVFGTAEGKEFPTEDKQFFLKVFQKIAVKYAQNQNHDGSFIQLAAWTQIDTRRNKNHDGSFIQLAAWTYRCGQDIFSGLINDTMKKMQNVADKQKQRTKIQDYTVCSNMLSQEQQKEFITFFEKHTGNVISDTYCGGVYEKVVHWIRALKGILSLFNDSLKLTEDETCEKCALHLCLIWENYIEHYKNQQYVKNVILCLLFLLRRRKYNHDFLREQSPAYEKIEKLCSESHEEYGNLTDILYDFLKGKGTIESLAQIKDSILDNES